MKPFINKSKPSYRHDRQQTTNHRRHRPPPVPRTRLFCRIRRWNLRRGCCQPRYLLQTLQRQKRALARNRTEQKNRVRAEFENLLARQCSLREAAEAVFALQRRSFEELYSAAFLRDIEENTDLELERFFHELNEEKYAFMRGFFHTLQQRRLIQPDLPVELIDLFIRQADILMRHPQLAVLYAAAPQKLPQDILGLLLHGLAGEKDE